MTMPLDKPRRGKVPLVVQPYDFPPDRFLPDGISTTAFAMQPLAASGIAVLQMGQPRQIVDEGPYFVEAIDSAVEMAAERFGIDAANVGLVGFSRSGGRTSYAITHPGRIKLKAALAADGGDANYTIYLNYAVTYPSIAKIAQLTLEAVNGGPPWTSKSTWLERAPGFNLDRVETPYLMTTVGPFAFLMANEVYTGLQLLKKPVDLVMYPEGAHQLMLPRERLASMELTVDWMSFWLSGRKNPDPAKAPQYERWAKLRALRDAKH
jgi:dipeptidyl aminopeptidase/acylaminoacyl peptidase